MKIWWCLCSFGVLQWKDLIWAKFERGQRHQHKDRQPAPKTHLVAARPVRGRCPALAPPQAPAPFRSTSSRREGPERSRSPLVPPLPLPPSFPICLLCPAPVALSVTSVATTAPADARFAPSPAPLLPISLSRAIRPALPIIPPSLSFAAMLAVVPIAWRAWVCFLACPRGAAAGDYRGRGRADGTRRSGSVRIGDLFGGRRRGRLRRVYGRWFHGLFFIFGGGVGGLVR